MAKKSKKSNVGKPPEFKDRVRAEASLERLELMKFDDFADKQDIDRSKLIRRAMMHYLETHDETYYNQEYFSHVGVKSDKSQKMKPNNMLKLARKLIILALNNDTIIDRPIKITGEPTVYDSIEAFLESIQFQFMFAQGPLDSRNFDWEKAAIVEKAGVLKLERYIEAEKEALSSYLEYTRLKVAINNYLEPEEEIKPPVLEI